MSARSSRCSGLAAPPTSFEHGPWRIPARSLPGPLQTWLIPLMIFQSPSRIDIPSTVRFPSSRHRLVESRTSSRGWFPLQRSQHGESTSRNQIQRVHIPTDRTRFKRACHPKVTLHPPFPVTRLPTLPAQQPTNRCRYWIVLAGSLRRVVEQLARLESVGDDKGLLTPNPGGHSILSAPARGSGRSHHPARMWAGSPTTRR
jgi:hypothetical protein